MSKELVTYVDILNKQMLDKIIALMENNPLIIIKFNGRFHTFCSTQFTKIVKQSLLSYSFCHKWTQIHKITMKLLKTFKDR